MASYSDIFGTGAMPTFNIAQGHGNTSWKYGGDESAAIMDAHLAERAADFADQKATFQDTTMPALKAWLNPDEPEADPLAAYFEQADAEAEAAQLSKEANANAAAVQAMTSDDAYTYTPEDQAAVEASELGEDIMSAGGQLQGGPTSQFLAARQGLDLVDSAQAKIRGADSVKNTIKKALNAPGIKGQLAKKIAMRAALMGTGPVGIAILLGDLAYMGAKAGSGYLADQGYIEQDYVGNFEDAVGEKASAGMDAVQGGLQAGTDYMRSLLPESWQEESTADPYGSMYRSEEQIARDEDMAEKYRAAYGLKDGGRIGLNTGGYLPWTQTMSSDYANQYYNQFNNPTSGTTTATQSTTPTQSDTPTDLGDLGTIVPTTVPLSGGLAQQRGSGPEDRGTWEQRFSPEHQYNRPGVHQGVAYDFNDDGQLVASHVPSNMTGMSVGDPAPAFLGGPLNMAAAGLGWLKDQIERKFVPESLKNVFSKDEEEQQQESAMQEAARDLGGTVDPEAVKQAMISSSASGGTGTKSYHTNKRLQAMKEKQAKFNQQNAAQGLAMTRTGDVYSTRSYSQKQRDRNRERAGQGRGIGGGGKKDKEAGAKAAKGKTGGGWCFHPDTLVQMADGSEQKINTIKIGDQTKGGEVTGVVQFKPLDEMHDYKGVIVAGSHFVKEDGRFIPVSESFEAVKVDIIPTVYSLDTTDRRIWIKDIEFADFNGDGIVKEFMYNAGFNLTGLQKEVLRQVEERLI